MPHTTRFGPPARVQLSGTSPYRHVPLDDRLAGLRDPVLFPGLRSDQPSGVTTRPLPADHLELLARAQADSRTVINRPQVPTIYPPVAQLWFAAPPIDRLPPRHPRYPATTLPLHRRPTGGTIANHGDTITARHDRRTYSPVLRQADIPDVAVPWWDGRRLHFEYA